MYYVYIVECKDKTLYTGWTTDIEKRLTDHNRGKGAKYTATRRPVVLKYLDIAETKSDACKKEYQIKQLTRAQKMQLIVKVTQQ